MQCKITKYLENSSCKSNNNESTNYTYFQLSKTDVYQKSVNKLYNEPDDGCWYKENLHKIPCNIIAKKLLDTGAFMQHVILECFQKYIDDYLKLDIHIHEIIKSNGRFDAKITGTKDSISKLCLEYQFTHNLPTINLEVKSIKIKDKSKKTGAIVDVQRIKPDFFEVMILGTYFKNTLNVYIGKPNTSWTFLSNGLSDDRGYRINFCNNISLHNNTETSLKNIDYQITKLMSKIFVIQLT